MQPLVFMGGTFDPVHNGHLRTALELKQWLGVDQVCLIPSGAPVHRDEPGCTPLQRLEMVQLAVQDEPALCADPREIESDAPSYSLLTLQALRSERGSDCPIIMTMGMDAYQTLPSWHQWESFLDYAHILVLARPGYEKTGADEQLLRFTEAHQASAVSELLTRPSGRVHIQELTPLGISATQIRRLIAQGHSPRYLLPEPVWHYIQQHKLYGYF
ncbi:nicotinate-nucleotide adenylyltransferase [Marinobacterium sediminicola]|uniref:Probable nicotinate-nucleotide adenylyltransferase n=1 Tax=Marinobacterium sediminicola TaxID=518898 RepID=A0ABY1S0S0_9GAMM|nr:nicotinate-nucleotide adenylyltransferase [Marinobacterium sediminicola]ULG69622.1 nicotinate-nucleotide adenylyltransferase [Marinobacterium sediminicola]SMR74650.1 nicotinate-nucleotide adenylyltransferase [Marinobacterium sediminicola]